jgi:hypothetical protein
MLRPEGGSGFPHGGHAKERLGPMVRLAEGPEVIPGDPGGSYGEARGRSEVFPW